MEDIICQELLTSDSNHRVKTNHDFASEAS